MTKTSVRTRMRDRSVRTGDFAQHHDCQTMFLSILNAPARWISQVMDILQDRMNHLSPSEYSVMLVACISIGWVLLRSKN